MPRPLLGITDQLGKPAVKPSPAAGVELRLDACSQKGVAETNTLVIELNYPRRFRSSKPPAHGRGVGCHALNDRDSRLAE